MVLIDYHIHVKEEMVNLGEATPRNVYTIIFESHHNSEAFATIKRVCFV